MRVGDQLKEMETRTAVTFEGNMGFIDHIIKMLLQIISQMQFGITPRHTDHTENSLDLARV
jgi:hypothetical protein